MWWNICDERESRFIRPLSTHVVELVENQVASTRGPAQPSYKGYKSNLPRKGNCRQSVKLENPSPPSGLLPVATVCVVNNGSVFNESPAATRDAVDLTHPVFRLQYTNALLSLSLSLSAYHLYSLYHVLIGVWTNAHTRTHTQHIWFTPMPMGNERRNENRNSINTGESTTTTTTITTTRGIHFDSIRG